MHNGKTFFFTVNEFVERLNHVFESETYLSDCEAAVDYSKGNIAVKITRYSESCYVFFFKDKDNMTDSADKANICNIIIAADDTYTAVELDELVMFNLRLY